MFDGCLLKKRFFHGKVAPSFSHTITAFWLDFEGLGRPGKLKNREKTAPGRSCFFGLKRKVNKFVFFMILGTFLEPFWSSKMILKSSNSISLCCSLSGGLQGPFWDHFWLYFGVIWGLLRWF